MRLEKFDLNVVQNGTGAGTAQLGIAELVDKWVHVEGIAGGASVTIEGSIDETNYVAITDPITADSIVEVPAAVKQVRVNRTVAGTGNPTVVLSGRHARTD